MAQQFCVFVDTNILLDFYRVRTESGLKLLSSLDTVRDRVITTYQVEMEFKRNRHSAILESLKNLKPPDKLPHAAFLAESQAANKLDAVVDDARKRVKKMRDRLKRVLSGPTVHDPVYQQVQRLFVSESPVRLHRAHEHRRTIKRLALRRFLLGYPPRKRADTSMGDALNWEWIIKVANDCNCHVLVVSRDADFGVEIDGDCYINDWLLQEFRDRVSIVRKLRLHTRLSSALKDMKVRVAKEAAREEEDAIAEAASQTRSEARSSSSTLSTWDDQLRKALEDLLQ